MRIHKDETTEMRALLVQYGYNPRDAAKLQREGMGPYELEHRLKYDDLHRTHGLQRANPLPESLRWNRTSGGNLFARGEKGTYYLSKPIRLTKPSPEAPWNSGRTLMWHVTFMSSSGSATSDYSLGNFPRLSAAKRKAEQHERSSNPLTTHVHVDRSYRRWHELSRDVNRYYEECWPGPAYLKSDMRRKSYCAGVAWKRIHAAGRFKDYPGLHHYAENPMTNKNRLLQSLQKAKVGDVLDPEVLRAVPRVFRRGDWLELDAGSGVRVDVYPSQDGLYVAARRTENPLSPGETTGITLGIIAAVATIGFAVYQAKKNAAATPTPPSQPIVINNQLPPPVTPPVITTTAPPKTSTWKLVSDATGNMVFQAGAHYRMSEAPQPNETFAQFVAATNNPSYGTILTDAWAPGSTLPADWPTDDTDPTWWRAEFTWVGTTQSHNVPGAKLYIATS